MAQVLVSGREMDVTESVEEVLRRISESRAGGALGTPTGWVILTLSGGVPSTVYVQASAIGWVQDDA